VWADVERFDIDDLLAAEHAGTAATRARSFAIQVPELTTVGVHCHDYYELGYVLEGRATHVVNGQAHEVSPGSVFLLSPADFHALDRSGTRPFRMVNAAIDPELVERVLESVLPAGDLDLPWGTSALPDAAADDVRRIREETSSRGPGWEVLVQSALTGALVELARAREVRAVEAETTGVGVNAAHLRRAVRHVERHFREPLTLAQVAAVAHLSPHWFSEQFRHATGDTFQSYLKRRRLQFARALLDSTEMGVTEVCHAAGFNDPSYFGRAYRAQFGVSPSGRSPSRGRSRVTGGQPSDEVP
jgi:AraC-like DNA-binding protein/mannose-6-phosphate isomerase-like protein (cupin superfamily)